MRINKSLIAIFVLGSGFCGCSTLRPIIDSANKLVAVKPEPEPQPVPELDPVSSMRESGEEMALTMKYYPIERYSSDTNGCTLIEESWYLKVGNKNPKILGDLSITDVGIIEVNAPDMNGVGSEAPFTAKAMLKGLAMGANAIKYKSGVETKNTERVLSMTFEAIRIEYKGRPINGTKIKELEKTISERELISLLVSK